MHVNIKKILTIAERK